MYNTQIFKPLGGGLRISAETAKRRTLLYITRKLHRNLRTVDPQDRALIMHLLSSRFQISVPELTKLFPFSRSTIYADIAAGKMQEEKLKPHLVKPRIDDFISYLLYNERYL